MKWKDVKEIWKQF